MNDMMRNRRAAVSPVSLAAGWRVLQLRVLLLVFLLFVVDGIDAQMLVLAVPALTGLWGLEAEAFRLPISIGYLGVALGASLGGLLSDRYGRRQVIVALAFLFGPATVLMALTSTPFQMTVLRFVAGLGLGGCMPPALTLLTETVRPSRRGLVVSLAMLSAPFGASISGLISAFVIPAFGWQTIFILGGGSAIAIAFLLLFFLPESPAFLIGQVGQERRTAALIDRLGIDAPDPVSGQSDSQAPSAAVRALFAGRYMPLTIAMLGAFLFVYVAGGIVLGWLPAFMGARGYPLSVTSVSMSIWSLAGIVGSVTIGFITTRFAPWHAAKLVPLLCIAAALALAGLFTLFRDPPLTFTYGLIAVCGALSSALIILLYACAAQCFPAHLRSSGIGFCATAGKLGGFVGTFGGASLIAWQGGALYFPAFALAVTCVLVLILHARRHSASPDIQGGAA